MTVRADLWRSARVRTGTVCWRDGRGRAARSGAGSPSSSRSRPGAAGPDSTPTRRKRRWRSAARAGPTGTSAEGSVVMPWLTKRSIAPQRNTLRTTPRTALRTASEPPSGPPGTPVRRPAAPPGTGPCPEGPRGRCWTHHRRPPVRCPGGPGGTPGPSAARPVRAPAGHTRSSGCIRRSEGVCRPIGGLLDGRPGDPCGAPERMSADQDYGGSRAGTKVIEKHGRGVANLGVHESTFRSYIEPLAFT